MMAHPILSLYYIVLSAMLITEAAPLMAPHNMKIATNKTEARCERQCGNLTVPYPFGIGLESGCSLSPSYDIVCATSYDPPRAFSPMITDNKDSMLQVLAISVTQIRVRSPLIVFACHNLTGGLVNESGSSTKLRTRASAPYTLSPTENRLTTLGCDYEAFISTTSTNDANQDQPGPSNCPSHCSSPEEVVAGECTRTNGCCETDIPKGSSSVYLDVSSKRFGSDNNSFIRWWYPCGYAFIAAEGSFSFRGAPDLNISSTVLDRVRNKISIVLDWFISNQTCSQARQNPTAYACAGDNVVCIDGDATGIGGYRCSCSPGFEGNPYLGCSDINECADEQSNKCSQTCINTPGGYKCFCPPGYFGDGRKDGTGCFPTVPVVLGTSFSFIVLVTSAIWISLKIREKMVRKKRDKFFQQNGGHLLKQLLSSGNMESAKLFTIKELASATNNFCENRVVGKGTFGKVYRGILSDNQVIAVKKSKLMDESQIEQFINELFILTRINHPNVVKLLGCCLEHEVPLLVYEFIPNGTLYDHIHAPAGKSWLSWSSCLRVATEAAKALAYLHSIPIIHRDIKSTNILVDDNNMVKICDFGISRLIPVGKTRLSTLVHGTLGYLDPEYFSSSHLTSKSDVYGFGVILAELLTREAPILFDETRGEETNLSTYFLKSKEVGSLKEIMDYELFKGASEDQVTIIGDLVQSCLSLNGKERPTMTEVAMVLEELIIQAT